MKLRSLGFVLALMSASSAPALDLDALWDFREPAASEQRFRAALADAVPDEVFILKTQIARSLGLRRQFAQARALLDELAPEVSGTSAEGRARHALELGRTLASAKHTVAESSAETKAEARAHFARALALARQAELDGLAIDAIHMMAFIDTQALEQLFWAKEALTIVERSTQPAAKRWEASIRHNLGYALHQQQRYAEALAQFQVALQLREAAGKAEDIHIARWMIARTLRALGRREEALALQLALEASAAAAGRPDPFVFEELEALYREAGDLARAKSYASKRPAGQ